MKKLVTAPDSEYKWVDLLDPGNEELASLAKEYGLHEESVNDSMEPDHLPKIERLRDYTFVIIRIAETESGSQSDSVQELTNKLEVFISQKFIITIHRKEWPPLQKINELYVQNGECKNPFHVLNEIVKEGLQSYDEPAHRLNRTIEYYEEHIFFRNRRANLLKGMYYLKRKSDVLRRILLLSFDIIDHIDASEQSNAYTRDIRDLYVKQQSIFDSLSENINHLLNIYFNISSQRTNEIIRVLTIFSVFFMPLTFVVGVYGMNFEHMPELAYKWGYPAVLILMAVIVVLIYVWFKRKKWL
jgi:magnesium transporter